MELFSYLVVYKFFLPLNADRLVFLFTTSPDTNDICTVDCCCSYGTWWLNSWVNSLVQEIGYWLWWYEDNVSHVATNTVWDKWSFSKTTTRLNYLTPFCNTILACSARLQTGCQPTHQVVELPWSGPIQAPPGAILYWPLGPHDQGESWAHHLRISGSNH